MFKHFFERWNVVHLLRLILSIVGDKSGKELPSFREQLRCLQFQGICHGGEAQSDWGENGPV